MAKLSKSDSTDKIPYWIIRDTVANMLKITMDAPIETIRTESGTIHRFMGTVLGHNLSQEDALVCKQARETPLNDAWCEIGMYESCLLNLSRDNYENIRGIFKELRRNIQNAKRK